MKKILCMVLAVLMTLSLTACGEISIGGFPFGGKDKETDVSVNNPVEKPDDKQEQQPAVTDDTEPGSSIKLNEVSIEEMVLVDEQGVKITATGIEINELEGYDVKLLIENNSGKDLTFQCLSGSVNGYMMDPVMSVDVPNGKKSNDYMSISNYDLAECGIDTIAEMEVAFTMFEMESWASFMDTDSVMIQTSAAGTYQQKYDDSGEVAYDSNDVKIVVKGWDEEATILGPGMVVYIDNNSDRKITVQAKDLSINGFMMEAYGAFNVNPGKHAIGTISVTESNLTENNISKIEDVECYFHVYDYESWETLVDTDKVTLQF